LAPGGRVRMTRDDFDRGLADRGRQRVRHLGRACETAARLGEHCGILESAERANEPFAQPSCRLALGGRGKPSNALENGLELIARERSPGWLPVRPVKQLVDARECVREL